MVAHNEMCYGHCPTCNSNDKVADLAFGWEIHTPWTSTEWERENILIHLTIFYGLESLILDILLHQVCLVGSK